MNIEVIHSFLVNPEKGVETQSQIRGTEVIKDTSSGLFRMLSEIFRDSIYECKYEIAFSHNENGEQKNICKDLFVKYSTTNDFTDGLRIAERLQHLTTKRSGLGLLFLMFGQDQGTKRLVISRFPADNGILAEEGKGSLSVQFVERIFMKNARAYKSAVYEGRNPESHFWIGRAIDKQINSDLTISDY